MRDLRARLRALHPATWVLLALIAAGIALRVLAMIAVWPVSPSLADPTAYAKFAQRNPLEDHGHPAGYASFLAVLGVFTRNVAAVVVVQHLLAFPTALTFYACVRRITGSPWPGLLPAAAVLLNPDLLFLESTVLSEPLFMAGLGVTFYAAVRAFDAPDPAWRWPLATGVLLGLLSIVRSAGIFLGLVIVLVLLLARPGWRWPSLRPAFVTAFAGGVILVGYAFGNLATNGRFEVGPAQGWHLYGRVAQFADCRVFTPPKGTRGLCESTPVPQRGDGGFYLYNPASPLPHTYGVTPWVKHDGDLRAFALTVIWSQPRAYVHAMWRDVKGYYVPSTIGAFHLDSELDWKVRTAMIGKEPIFAEYVSSMEVFFDDFSVRTSNPTAAFLRGYQRIVRFGATMLSITSLLTLIGLLVGPRRHRIGVLLFGVGGLALLLAPLLSVFYVARYMVPLAAPMLASAAITILTLYRLDRADRRRDVGVVAASATTADLVETR